LTARNPPFGVQNKVNRIKPFSHIGSGLFKNGVRKGRKRIVATAAMANLGPLFVPVNFDLSPAMGASQSITVAGIIEVVNYRYFGGKFR